MNAFHACPLWLLGSTLLFDPYHTASARPGPPALIHGKTFTASPVRVEASLARTGRVQVRHPDAAEDALTYTWRCDGLLSLVAQTTNRLRAESIESTEKRVSGEPGRLSAMWTRLPLSGPPPELAVGASRNVRSPVASGVPMFSNRSNVPSELGEPAASKTLPV